MYISVYGNVLYISGGYMGNTWKSQSEICTSDMTVGEWLGGWVRSFCCWLLVVGCWLLLTLYFGWWLRFCVTGTGRECGGEVGK